MESKFVTVQAHWVTLDEFGDGGEAVAQQAALTKRARLLGLCLLQSQQLELAFEGLAKSLGVTNDEASSVPLGKLLAKLHGSCERRRYPAGGVPEYSSSWFLGLMV